MHRCLGCMKEYKEEYQVCPFCGYEVGTPPKEAYHMVPGTLLAGRYTIGKVLGFGGFGVTYIGYDTVLNRKVAIKEYLPSEFSTRVPGQIEVTTYEGERTEQFASGLGKFLEEAAMLAKLQTANGVVQIYNSFKENATAYIVMEYLEGKTLKSYLEEKEKLSVEEAKDILHPIVIALKDVHELGILHRDIAPDNIFLTNDGKVKLLDFGASRFATTSHSKSLSVIIKQGYAPVEQYRSRGDQGTWTDVYSLAATFYKMVTGITPEDAMERVEKEELKKPSKLGIDIPKNVENAIMNALNIKIEDRTQNVEIFEKELYRDEKVKLHFVHLKKADVGKMPLWAKISISAASLAVGIFAVLLMTGTIEFYRLIPESFALPEGMTRVPNLVNEDVIVAEEMLTEAQLYIQIMDKQYSEYIPEGMVLLQNVDRGKIVSTNEIIEVIISGGLELVYMRDIRGYTKENAINMLAASGIVVEIIEEYGDYAPGAVIAQSIAPAEQTHRGAVVVLTVSKGYDTYVDNTLEVAVPDLQGMTLAEAQAEAKKYGLYLVKTGEKDGHQEVGSILEQVPAAGTTAHQGDIIEFVVVAEELLSYMPDVQYKDEATAIAQLEELGLEVETVFEENNSVAKGKVISQDITAYSEVRSGDKVTLIISLGSEEIEMVKAEEPQWSEWVTELPAGVTASDYEIEEKIQYSFRDKSTMTSLETSIPGWTQYDSVTVQGEFGPWSEWSTEQPAEGANREIEQKTQYAYSDYETVTLLDQSSYQGWVLKGAPTPTYELNDWGAWSEWLTEKPADSTYREINQKTQYQYQQRTWQAQANNPNLAGYTRDDSRTIVEYGEWSDWSENIVSESSTLQVENSTGSRKVQTGTTYTYNYFRWYCNGQFSYREDYAEQLGGGDASYSSATSTVPYAEDGRKYTDPNTKEVWILYKDANGSLWFQGKTTETPIMSTQTYPICRSRTITTTYYFYQWSNWSGWGDNAISSNADTNVDTRTVYQYRDQIPHYYYTFENWTPYTNFSDEVATASATRQVQTRTLYKYRDRTNVTTYYYYQWGTWSDWRDEAVEASGSREVQQRVLYRYREK